MHEVANNGNQQTHTHSHYSHQQEPTDPKTVAALLRYMLNHNISHAEELHNLAHQLEDIGQSEAARAVDKACAFYHQGNTELRRAVDLQ
jgi:cell division protein FtsB